MNHIPFVVCSLPRSRSYWTSCFLTHCGKSVGHDMLIGLRTYQNFVDTLRSGEVAGSVETAGMLSWKVMRHRLPEARIALLRRHPDEVIRSLNSLGWFGLEEEVWLRNNLLDAMENMKGVRSFQFADLDDPLVAKDLFEFCTRTEFNEEGWRQIKDQNMQLDMHERAKVLRENGPQLREFKNSVLREAQRLGGAACLGLN